MYAPGMPTVAAVTLNPELSLDRTDLEYVEIFNPTAEPVDLTEWRLRLGIDLDFDPGTQIGAGQTLLVISFNPANPANSQRVAAFRAHYSLDNDVPLVGGYTGSLSDSGEGVRLVRPGAPPLDEPTTIPRLLEDEVIYDDVAPWPLETAAAGMSLSRTSAEAYGNAPGSWTAASPSPGLFGGDVAGDLTGDGRVDLNDIDHLQTAALAGDLSADLTGDGILNEDDVVFLVEGVIGTSIGDVNFDGVFDSADLVALFIAGQFEDAIAGNSTYVNGDWNLDGEFTNADLLFALRRNGYVQESAPQPLAAIPAAALAAALPNDEVFADDELFADEDLDWIFAIGD